MEEISSPSVTLFKELMDKVYGECQVSFLYFAISNYFSFYNRMKLLLNNGNQSLLKKAKGDIYGPMHLESAIT